MLVTDSGEYFTKGNLANVQIQRAVSSSVEGNVRNMASQETPYREGNRGPIQSIGSSEITEQYLAMHDSEVKKSKSNRVINQTAGPYTNLASSQRNENTTESDFFNLTREDDESQFEQSKKGESGPMMKI